MQYGCRLSCWASYTASLLTPPRSSSSAAPLPRFLHATTTPRLSLALSDSLWLSLALSGPLLLSLALQIYDYPTQRNSRINRIYDRCRLLHVYGYCGIVDIRIHRWSIRRSIHSIVLYIHTVLYSYLMSFIPRTMRHMRHMEHVRHMRSTRRGDEK